MNKNIVFLLLLLNCPLAFGLDSVEIKQVTIEAARTNKVKVRRVGTVEEECPYALVVYSVLDGQARTYIHSDTGQLRGVIKLSIHGEPILESCTIDVQLQGAVNKKVTVRTEILFFKKPILSAEYDLTLTGEASINYLDSEKIEMSKTGKIIGFDNGKVVVDPPDDFLQRNKELILSPEKQDCIVKAYCTLIDRLTSMIMVLPPNRQGYDECKNIILAASNINSVIKERITKLDSEIIKNKDILGKLEEKALRIRNSELDRIATANIDQLKNTIRDGEKEINEWKNRIDELEKTRKVLEQYKEILELALPAQAK